MVFRKIIQGFLDATASAQRRQIISLGCGFDTISFEYSQLSSGDDGASSPNLVFFELDHREIIEKKAEIVLSEPNLSRRVIPTLESESPSRRSSYGFDLGVLKLLAGDLRDVEGIARSLAAAGVTWGEPTLVLTECVLVCKYKVNIEWLLSCST